MKYCARFITMPSRFSPSKETGPAYMPVSQHKSLPAPAGFKPPLLREHRLYQADWLMDHHQPTFPSNRDSCCQPSRPGSACSRPARRR